MGGTVVHRRPLTAFGKTFGSTKECAEHFGLKRQAIQRGLDKYRYQSAETVIGERGSEFVEATIRRSNLYIRTFGREDPAEMSAEFIGAKMRECQAAKEEKWNGQHNRGGTPPISEETA